MISSNKVELLGKLGKDPIKFFNRSDKKPYCEFSIYEDTKRNGQPVSIEHKCEAWGDIATMMQRTNILPGSEILIHGKLVVHPLKDTGYNIERIFVLNLNAWTTGPYFYINNNSNKVEMLGKLGKDAIKFFNRSDNKPYCEFSICENLKRNGQPVSIWHKCEAWGDIATMMQRMNILPGSEMKIEGKLVSRPINNTDHKTERPCVLDFKVYRPNPKFRAEGEN